MMVRAVAKKLILLHLVLVVAPVCKSVPVMDRLDLASLVFDQDFSWLRSRLVKRQAVDGEPPTEIAQPTLTDMAPVDNSSPSTAQDNSDGSLNTTPSGGLPEKAEQDPAKVTESPKITKSGSSANTDQTKPTLNTKSSSSMTVKTSSATTLANNPSPTTSSHASSAAPIKAQDETEKEDATTTTIKTAAVPTTSAHQLTSTEPDSKANVNDPVKDPETTLSVNPSPNTTTKAVFPSAMTGSTKTTVVQPLLGELKATEKPAEMLTTTTGSVPLSALINATISVTGSTTGSPEPSVLASDVAKSNDTTTMPEDKMAPPPPAAAMETSNKTAAPSTPAADNVTATTAAPITVFSTTNISPSNSADANIANTTTEASSIMTTTEEVIKETNATVLKSEKPLGAPEKDGDSMNVTTTAKSNVTDAPYTPVILSGSKTTVTTNTTQAMPTAASVPSGAETTVGNITEVPSVTEDLMDNGTMVLIPDSPQNASVVEETTTFSNNTTPATTPTETENDTVVIIPDSPQDADNTTATPLSNGTTSNLNATTVTLGNTAVVATDNTTTVPSNTTSAMSVLNTTLAPSQTNATVPAANTTTVSTVNTNITAVNEPTNNATTTATVNLTTVAVTEAVNVTNATTLFPTTQTLNTTTAPAVPIFTTPAPNTTTVSTPSPSTDTATLQKISVTFSSTSSTSEPTVNSNSSASVSESQGLSASALTAIITGSIIGFWIILGPIICLICKVRDKRKERYHMRLTNQSDPPADNGMLDAMIISELKKTSESSHDNGTTHEKDKEKEYNTVAKDKAETEGLRTNTAEHEF